MTDLIEVRVSNLIGAPLDWAVAKAEAVPVFIDHQRWVRKLPDDTSAWRPSWNWTQGGPLFDKHLGSAHHNPHLEDNSCRYSAGPAGAGIWLYGPTALVAFCRTLVLTKLGDTVQVPKELIYD
ncbi:phage protein NinX family protein [Pseudomonas monteilii]|uniref:DUF2591 domain-containing protein n=1 Tax=Pseudomonas monteilii TaxID=76759 RepID=A0A2N1IMA1_9PSED|nr:phage protein NinX family protein [Pseudomonas monteilii]PKI19371.1 DUF2591 domain-containing protein [Pseudomonas monteilii]RPD91939.1 DUF2591 domain-containing protein [Pseudomonas monteilii]